MSQSFAILGLSAELTRVVAEQGYSEPTPVQAQAIPIILAGRDVLAGAQTGTGKTAGFTLPLLQRLAAAGAAAAHTPRRVRALILTPTRELAAQVEESVRTYGQYLPLKSTLIYGGVNINPQIEALRRGVDILVATPGRLLDHLQQKTANLSYVEILVLDEADRMLDMGFIRDIRRILALLPAKRQNLLFSATFSNEIRQLADGLLQSPAMIEVARRNAESELVAQRIHPVDAWRKRELLTHLVSSGDWRQVLVFTRMKSGANRLAEQLCKDGIEATAIHGNKSQPARTRALAGFKAGTVRVLVATDIAARGLDIEELPHVVNFELPNVPEDYVHRIGRTGRAGSTGEAISLVSKEENSLLADIEKLLTRRIDRQIVPGFEPGQVPPPQVLAAAQAAERGARDGNRRGGGHGKASPPRTPGSAAQPARAGASASTPVRAAPQPGAARAPQRARTTTAVPLPALFRSPTRRGS
ncbi:MAG: DEAD/DEAH box helicase [Candidatus Accumulibacter sp.]|uniref:ATP-dependent RNA helicase RhlE n=1 Tax=Candidatus Accumulibacter affinis TaxID=2954384 RepID=A0A935TCL9_9PROT|nr:DEAD/DEAH box helicase [Candidatus Accumulibacter affinis]